MPCCAGSASAADPGVRVEHRPLLVRGQTSGDLVRTAERIVESGEPLDERRAPLEQLSELLDGQLPR